MTGDGCALWGMLLGLIGLVTSPIGGGLLFGPIGLVFAALAQGRPVSAPSRITAAMGLSVAGLLLSAYVSVFGMERLFSGGVREWEGARAPDFVLKTVDGGVVKLSDFRGKRVFVDVWATWCPPCAAMQPDLNRLAREWESKGVVVLGLSADTDSRIVSRYADQRPFAYPVGWMDADIPKPYRRNVMNLPVLFVVDRNGVIVAVEEGLHSYEALTELAAIPDFSGAPKDPPESERATGE